MVWSEFFDHRLLVHGLFTLSIVAEARHIAFCNAVSADFAIAIAVPIPTKRLCVSTLVDILFVLH